MRADIQVGVGRPVEAIRTKDGGVDYASPLVDHRDSLGRPILTETVDDSLPAVTRFRNKIRMFPLLEYVWI